MRHALATALALTLAASLTACGKPQGQGSGSASGPPAPAPTLEQMKAAQAALPAPYNTADLANGEAKFALCASCHTITPGGPNMTGPNLHGVVGHQAGHHPDFNYSDALKQSGFTWDAATLDKWLTDPRADVPGTKMSFVGLKDEKDRTDVIAYLMVNK
jgi:cytochrome c